MTFCSAKVLNVTYSFYPQFSHRLAFTLVTTLLYWDLAFTQEQYENTKACLKLS